MFDVHFLSMGPGGGTSHIWEISRATEITGDLTSHVSASYYVENGACDCEVFLRAKACPHADIVSRKLIGPRIPGPDIDQIIKEFRTKLAHCSEVIIPVGFTSTRRKPIYRADLLVQAGSDRVELWSNFDKYLVRVVFATPETFDLTLKLENDIMLFDQGTILHFEGEDNVDRLH